MTDCIQHNIRVAGQRIVIQLDDVRMLNGFVQLHFVQGIVLVFQAVAGDALDRIAFASCSVLHQIDQTESPVFVCAFLGGKGVAFRIMKLQWFMQCYPCAILSTTVYLVPFTVIVSLVQRQPILRRIERP